MRSLAAAEQVSTNGTTSVWSAPRGRGRGSRSGHFGEGGTSGLSAVLASLAPSDRHLGAGIVLGAYGAGTDHDDVGQVAQYLKQPAVAEAAEAAGGPSIVAPPSMLLIALPRTQARGEVVRIGVQLVQVVVVEGPQSPVAETASRLSGRLPSVDIQYDCSTWLQCLHAQPSEANAARAPRRLADRNPSVSPDRLIVQLVPPPTFVDVTFGNYRPSPDEPTQTAAVASCLGFLPRVGAAPGRKEEDVRQAGNAARRGLYLDGGFGVGKTHLLASAYWELPDSAEHPKAFATSRRADAAGGCLRIRGVHRNAGRLCRGVYRRVRT